MFAWRAASCLSPFLQWRGLPVIYFCRLCLLKVVWRAASFPFSSEVVASWLLLWALFTESSRGEQLLAFPPFLLCSRHPTLSAACPFQFLVYYSVFFCGVGGQSIQGIILAVGVPCATYLLTCWSASPKQVWSWCLVVWEPSCFLSVTWCGEDFYGLGVQSVWVLLLFGVFFLPSVAPASQQYFWSMELMLSASSGSLCLWILLNKLVEFILNTEERKWFSKVFYDLQALERIIRSTKGLPWALILRQLRQASLGIVWDFSPSWLKGLEFLC
jgi:hypothetical protein